MDGGIMTLQGQNRHIVGWNREHTALSVLVLLMQIAFLVLHMLLCVCTQWCPICPCSMHTMCVCQQELWAFASITLIWWDKHGYSPFAGRFHPKLLQWLSSLNWPFPHKTPLCLETTTQEVQIWLERNSSRWIPRLEQRHSGLHGGE